nr:MarR family transcriptional regulator [Novosphingobium sp. FKTRR1]
MEVVVDIEAGALQTAKAIYAIRRRRDSAAGFRGLFGEPAWDILLELYIAQKSRTELQVSSVCIEAGVPSTTILRWIARLERDGLVYREADRGDARRRYVRLTSEGHALMVRLLGAIGPMG